MGVRYIQFLVRVPHTARLRCRCERAGNTLWRKEENTIATCSETRLADRLLGGWSIHHSYTFGHSCRLMQPPPTSTHSNGSIVCCMCAFGCQTMAHSLIICVVDDVGYSWNTFYGCFPCCYSFIRLRHGSILYTFAFDVDA